MRRKRFELTHRIISTNGVRLHAVTCGPEDGPLVVLLHGFPEFWYGWRHQLHVLAQAGFWVVAPDQRGYNLSEKPRAVSAYNLDHLAADVAGLVEACGHDRAALVGHDWGGVVAWWVALTFPDRVSRLAILNAPHPAVVRRNWRKNLMQRLRSTYVLFFQVPGLSEFLFRRIIGVPALVRTSRRGAFTRDDLALYRQAWAQPGAMRAMLCWYRAFLRAHPPDPPSPRVTAPTRVLWGRKDPFFVRAAPHQSLDFCDEAELVEIDATHWLQHEAPDAVNAALLEFFNG